MTLFFVATRAVWWNSSPEFRRK